MVGCTPFQKWDIHSDTEGPTFDTPPPPTMHMHMHTHTQHKCPLRPDWLVILLIFNHYPWITIHVLIKSNQSPSVPMMKQSEL